MLIPRSASASATFASSPGRLSISTISTFMAPPRRARAARITGLGPLGARRGPAGQPVNAISSLRPAGNPLPAAGRSAGSASPAAGPEHAEHGAQDRVERPGPRDPRALLGDVAPVDAALRRVGRALAAAVGRGSVTSSIRPSALACASASACACATAAASISFALCGSWSVAYSGTIFEPATTAAKAAGSSCAMSDCGGRIIVRTVGIGLPFGSSAVISASPVPSFVSSSSSL